MKLLFATSNQNKAIEIAEMLPSNFEILTLKDINHFEDVPETSDTIQGNACQKANFIKDKYALDCFADDTGLEVLSLDGDPGVRADSNGRGIEVREWRRLDLANVLDPAVSHLGYAGSVQTRKWLRKQSFSGPPAIGSESA